MERSKVRMLAWTCPKTSLTCNRDYVLGLISKANVVPGSPRKRKRVRSQSLISVDMDESDPLPGPSRLSSSNSGICASSLNPQRQFAIIRLVIAATNRIAFQQTTRWLAQYAQDRSLIATSTITSTAIVPTRAKARLKLKAAHRPMPGRSSCDRRSQNPKEG